MPVLGKLALAVVAGGVALGTMLGAAANPVMKMPPEKPWQGALQAPVAADAGYLMIEAPPQDLSPYRDSYAPTWAQDELADWEPEYPDWTYSELIDEPYADPAAAEDAALDAQQVVLAVEAAATPPPAASTAPEPNAPDPATQVPPATSAAHPRLAARLDDVY